MLADFRFIKDRLRRSYVNSCAVVIAGMNFMQTDLSTIISSALGLFPPWEVKAVALSKEDKRLDITVDVAGKKFLACPACGEAGNHYLTRLETWHHGSFLDYATYLHARVPQVECCGTVVPIERPWSRPGSKFALLC